MDFTCNLNSGTNRSPFLVHSSLSVGRETVQSVSVVRDLGVLLDAELSMNRQHVNKVAATCYYQLRRLRQVRRRAGQEVTTQLILALVTSRLDYCNLVLPACHSLQSNHSNVCKTLQPG